MYSQSKRPILTLTIIAAAIVEAHRAIALDGTYAATGEHMHGVSDTNSFVDDELAVDVLGTTTCEAGAAIVKGALIEVGANGKFITKAAGKVVGRALSAAAADGSKFEALLLPSNA
ncbi:DUF2190 family protein [Colwellia psychrerythraea]|uniref:DUF2190 domain-containing protein n=1 Tax=Colwellia psychrerythraea TaxID=28229 RepID=A0A099KPM7_COLPS|nr:DUF2190 family protein [Colwellia psychrerythraea]KGJ92130.1 hypothetical protein ND2E_3023 [Colwellia psychrerythraea]